MTPAYPPFPGGGERYVRSLALGLVAQGHEVTAVTSAALTESEFWNGSAVEEAVSEQLDGVDIIRCALRPFPGGRRSLMAWRKAMVLTSMLPDRQTTVLQKMAAGVPPLANLSDILAQLSPHFDIVHGFNISWEYPMLAGWRWAKTHQIPYVATPFAHLGTGDDKVARNSTMKHQLQLLHEAERVLVLTAIEQMELVARGVPSQKLDVIYGGLDPLPKLLDTAAVRQKYKLKKPFAIFVGRASYDKGALHAAEAVLTLWQTDQPLTLVLVGQSSPEFERFYLQLSAQEQQWIRPLGILTDEEKHALLAETKLLLLPSRTDSFGIVLLEAWAHGKPVVAAKAGGVPGVVDEGENGLLVPFGDVQALSKSIQILLKDASLSEKMGKQGQNKVTAVFDWNEVTCRVLVNYQKILEKEENL